MGPPPKAISRSFRSSTVFDTKIDKSYDGTPLELSITLEDIVGSNSWGENIYQIHCGSKAGTVKIYYDKGQWPNILEG